MLRRKISTGIGSITCIVGSLRVQETATHILYFFPCVLFFYLLVFLAGGGGGGGGGVEIAITE